MKIKIALFAATAFAFATVAEAQSISSTILQTNADAMTGASVPTPVSSAPFDYTATNYLQFISIDSIFFRLTIEDGNTGFGPVADEFDFDQWTLALDGISTGILLNGFSSIQNSEFLDVTVDFSGSITNSAAILAALQLDGLLQASILDATGTNTGVIIAGNEIRLGNITDNAMTTLTINGAIPEPSSFALLGLAAVGWFGRGAFRRIRG